MWRRVWPTLAHTPIFTIRVLSRGSVYYHSGTPFLVSRSFWSAHASSRRFGKWSRDRKRCEDASHSKSTPRHAGRAVRNLSRTSPQAPHGRGCGVGRARGPGLGRGVGVGRTVAVGVAVAVAVAVGVAVAVAVGLGVVDGVGVGVPPPWPGAWISTVIGSPVLKKPTVALAVCGG